MKVLYNPEAPSSIHAAWSHQACARTAIFSTAASRRSLTVSPVPVWLVILSDQLDRRLCGRRYLTNKANPICYICGWQQRV